MYKHILVPVDNSNYSNRAINIGLDIAKYYGSTIVGSHVYAAKLHDNRFKQMEGGLPEPYKEEGKLIEQRSIHDSLIKKGLQIITDSFLDVFEKKCREVSIPFQRKSMEGRNFEVLVKDIKESCYDLVIIGALGVGAVKETTIGSVCERVVRRIKTDVLVVREDTPVQRNNKIVVAIDGSTYSYGGIRAAIELSKVFKSEIDIISSFDPFFHYTAFSNIALVLSKESAEIFKFKEQEKLHEEIIDDGMARIYNNHLTVARKMVEDEGIVCSTNLLTGKAFKEILHYVQKVNPWLLVLGKIGIHSENGMDIGSSTENVLRYSPCNLLIISRQMAVPKGEALEDTIGWTKEAVGMLEKVPPFVKGMAKKMIARYALDHDYSIVTTDIINEVMKDMMPKSSKIPT